MLQQIADLIGLPARQRLAACLMQLAKGKGLRWIMIQQSGLAEMVGVTRKTANQFLDAFEREGWIELGRERLQGSRSILTGRPARRPTGALGGPRQIAPRRGGRQR